jgi:hypothetical protein
MKIRSILGLCLSGSLLFAGQAALADNDKEKSNNRSARAVQVHVDKDTGQKIPEDDSAASAAEVSATSVSSSDAMDRLMPAENQAPVEHSNGATSVRLGQESMRYLTVTIDENGEMHTTHQTLDEFENETELSAEEKGLE